MPMTDLDQFQCTICQAYVWYAVGDWYCKCQHLNDKAFALTALPLPTAWQRAPIPPPVRARLSLEEALTQIAALQHSYTWWLTPYGSIRAGTEETPMCPITALASDQWPVCVSLVWVIAQHLGLASQDACALVKAADNSQDGCDLALRARLLAAVGLTEQATAQLAWSWAPET